MKRNCWLPLLVCLWVAVGCGTSVTTNSREDWLRWAHHKPPPDVQVLHSEYEQYSHWTNEYVLYLHLHASALWVTEFLAQNQLNRVAVPFANQLHLLSGYCLQSGFLLLPRHRKERNVAI